MKFLQKSSEGNSFRATFEFAESGDYKPFLLDLTGDGDKRYLILTEYLGGNDAFNYRGKDNFSLLGEVPAGEICDYPTGNKEFIFTLSDSIACFGAQGYATVSVQIRASTLNPIGSCLTTNMTPPTTSPCLPAMILSWSLLRYHIRKEKARSPEKKIEKFSFCSQYGQVRKLFFSRKVFTDRFLFLSI